MCEIISFQLDNFNLLKFHNWYDAYIFIILKYISII